MNALERKVIETVSLYTARYEEQRNLALDNLRLGGNPSDARVHAALAQADATILGAIIAASPEALR